MGASKEQIVEALGASPFRPLAWARNRHAQTLFPHFARRELAPPTRSERWPRDDGDELSVHHKEGDGPRLVVFHGLEGSVSSGYVIGLLRAFPCVTVMEHRSCDGRINQAKRLYHLGETTDLDFVVRELVRREPQRKLLLCGFSLGANQLLKWLGESAPAVPEQVAGAFAVSAPFDLLVSGPNLDKVLWGQYTKHFLKTLVPKALAKADQFPGVLDTEKIRTATTFAAFDTYGTAALHGFVDAKDYWRRVSSGQFLPAIETPTVLLSSADDPFNPGSTLPRELARVHPYLIPQFTERGGHVGFVAGTLKRPRYWAEEQLATFMRLL
ncbi:MAG: alpha/beta hydrolase [Clostridia bacterium]|nr:alpha/beta hydrolase [Deltaproteobacteria bacterium]